MSDFIQEGPNLQNQFEDDQILVNYINHKIPDPIKRKIVEDLTTLGDRVTSDVLLMAKKAEANPPKLIQFDPWGKRIDKVVVDEAWNDLHKVSAEEKIVSTGYDKSYGVHARVVQFAKLYLFHPSSAFYSCPLAMTDGAAKLIELYGDDELKKKAFVHLTSSSSKNFWTSGQWMTEKTGGSDVSNTETIAKYIDGEWRLYGTKWFTSAITSEIAMALARIEDEKGETQKGSRGLSLFYVEIRNENGDLNNIEVLRLKDKLGTKALPTAELRLLGTRAKLVGKTGDGVKQIASMFNVTRLYNSVTSIAAFRRILTLADNYSSKRWAFNKKIQEHALNASLIKAAKADFTAAFYFTFLVAEIFGNEENFIEKNELNLNRDELNKILRFLTPVLKLYTAKRTVIWTSELLEVFGGAGYIEDTGIPTLYRDNQVFSIWEGTTNVLSLDLLRAIKKDQSWGLMINFLKSETSKMQDHEGIELEIEKINQWFLKISSEGESSLEENAREIAFKFGDLVSLISWKRFLTKAVKNLEEEKLLNYFKEAHF